MLEEAINNQTALTNGGQPTPSSGQESVFQVTTLSSLPLKSPKRLIAIQLASHNPSFRERFRQKLEASGGPILANGSLLNQVKVPPAEASYQQKTDVNNSTPNENTHDSSMWTSDGNYSTYDPHATNNNIFMNERDFEALMNSPNASWLASAGVTEHFFPKQSDDEDYMDDPVTNANTLSNAGFTKKKDSLSPLLNGKFISDVINSNSNTATKRQRKSKNKDLVESLVSKTNSSKSQVTIEEESDAKPLKLKQKKRKDANIGDSSTQQVTIAESGQGEGGSSIIKRRRKGELQIMVDGGLGLNTNALGSALLAGPLTNAIKNNLLTTEMGPPEDTPNRNPFTSRNNPLSTSNNNPLTGFSLLSNTFSYLDSPFLDKNMLFSDGFGLGGDTPSKIIHLDGPLSKPGPLSTLGTDGLKFDFDEAVAGHFPSPRAGEYIKGSSPYRWSAGSANSVGSTIFTFPEGVFSTTGNKSNPFNDIVPPPPSNLSEAEEPVTVQEKDAGYSKKFKKTQKKEKQAPTIVTSSSHKEPSSTIITEGFSSPLSLPSKLPAVSKPERVSSFS